MNVLIPRLLINFISARPHRDSSGWRKWNLAPSPSLFYVQ